MNDKKAPFRPFGWRTLLWSTRLVIDQPGNAVVTHTPFLSTCLHIIVNDLCSLHSFTACCALWCLIAAQVTTSLDCLDTHNERQSTYATRQSYT
ncbi:predicted protein [Lichtheimia corymbifera JMRC:FSU:9682]|uniref:Uncharacterized protein n=1 Tax=Lichtheimia corymbifera JMRC:FSU:9682 TaxID=1263082 RepID=A0A068SBK9_9FUNG|nr:predicted protein [Lichtheimia corymbifera JMRC:FSU:9682]